MNPTVKKTIRNITTNYSYWISFVLLTIVAGCVSNNFFSPNNIASQFKQSAIIGIVAMGMSMVITAGMIDLSVGSTVAITSGLSVLVLNNTGSIFLTLVFCLGFGALCGAVNGVLITKGRIAPFIVTLATMSAYRSIIVQLGQGGPFNVDKAYYEAFRQIAAGSVFGIPYLAIFFVGVALVIGIVMAKTKFGKYIYAVGSNEQAARLTGINTGAIKMAVMSLTGMLCGLASFLYASRLTSITAANAGDAFEMDAIAAVAIGGTSMSGGRGKIIGTFLGVLMLRMISTILIMANIPPFLNGLVKGVIIIVAVLAQRREN